MQEDIEDRTVTLMVNSTKFTGRTLKNAIAKLLHHMKNQSSKQVVHHGKQTVKQLIGQDQGVSNIETVSYTHLPDLMERQPSAMCSPEATLFVKSARRKDIALQLPAPRMYLYPSAKPQV